jgi:hypothetical protein
MRSSTHQTDAGQVGTHYKLSRRLKRRACLLIAQYSRRCFARRSLSRRPPDVLLCYGALSVKRSRAPA